jgi:methylmalonyl-CoA mutase N-terminal domain/subunit
MKERFNAKDKNSLKLRFHSQTAGISLTAQQPNVNIVRVAIQALAAVLGGTQSLHTCGADEALSIPTEESVTLSLRTQQVIAHETGATDVVDPLGGSYYIEYLTSQLEKEAMNYIKRIDEMGGMTAAIENSFIQQEIQNNAYAQQKSIESGKEKVVGVNIFRADEKLNFNTFQLDKEFEKRIMKSLKELKEQRDDNLLKEKLEQLKKVARSDENIMPIMIDVVKSYATIQEISDVLREVFGEYKGSQTF